MKAIRKLLLAAAAIGSTSLAQAQEAPPPPPNPGLTGENSTVRNGGDTSDRDMAAARDAAIAKARNGNGKKAARTVPARPEEVTAGSDVRDSRGVRVGSIESVSMGAAVLKADGGAVEVPLEAFGKDGKGLVIAMTKAEFDKLVADANKPQ